ncbi:MAG: protoheme IX farnesyltransferase [Saccharospirillaceae bacterium]|nr:heme o synthase [Pseudomonadales bacterium]NRB79117.1 protoheme IX farnesyltransferase [Saccharospirillaceae bacterium]
MKTTIRFSNEQSFYLKIKLNDYLVLSKHKVVLMLMLTAWVGMLLAPTSIAWWQQLVCLCGIGFLSGAAAVMNHIIDLKHDKKMARTKNRPLVAKRVTLFEAKLLALFLVLSGACLIQFSSNSLTTILTFLSLFGYAIFYTVILKWLTPQNIVIGGLAGAMPPLLGWVSQTGQMDPQAWILVMIVFTWTLLLFWALAIYRRDDYALANVPMLPVTHGIEYSKTCVLLYSIILFIVCLIPYLIGMSGVLYLLGALFLNGLFVYKAVRLKFTKSIQASYDLFRYSIIQLLCLFLVLLIDKWVALI